MDWASDLDSQRSTSGYVFFLFGGTMSWMSKRKPKVFFPTKEENYVYKHASLMRSFSYKGSMKLMVLIEILLELDVIVRVPFLAKNPIYHAHIKHVDVQYHIMWETIHNGNVLLEKIDTLDNVTNSLTKLMTMDKLSWCRKTKCLDTYT